MSRTERTVRLVERRRSTISNSDTKSDETTVHCPLSRSARGVSHCLRCPRFERRAMVGGRAHLDCRLPEEVKLSSACGELIRSELTCLDSELEASKAVEVLEAAGVSSAPVMDDNGVLIGIASISALVQLRAELGTFHGFGRGLTPLEVEDAMSTELVTVPQHAPVAEAVRLMVSRNLERMTVVTEGGHLVGVIDAVDLMAWLSKHLTEVK